MIRILGIDPGQSTGLAVFVGGKLDELGTCRPLQLAEVIERVGPSRVVYEDSRLQSYLWTARDKAAMGVALKTARNLGQIDAWCGLILEVCEQLGIDAIGVSPKNKGAKMDAQAFATMTGWTGSSNQHERDAAMVAWPYRKSALTTGAKARCN